jgi:hypothetical protein
LRNIVNGYKDLRDQSSGAVGGSPSPRTKVNNLIGSRHVSKNVRKELVFSAVLQKQLKHNVIEPNTVITVTRLSFP